MFSAVRKLVVRLFLCSLAFSSVVLLVACVAGYLATEQPTFYAELLSDKIPASEQQSAQLFVQMKERELKLWSDRAIARQQVQLSKLGAEAEAVGEAPAYDPANDTHTLVVTERQINAILASAPSKPKDDWQNPRFRIRQDHVDFAFEVVSVKFRCVLSVELKPSLMTDGRLRLDLVGAKVGRLPLPLATILNWLPRDVNPTSRHMQFHLHSPTPYVVLNLPTEGPKSPQIAAIRCSNGTLAIDFAAPVISPDSETINDDSLALSQSR